MSFPPIVDTIHAGPTIPTGADPLGLGEAAGDWLPSPALAQADTATSAKVTRPAIRREIDIDA
ncbi:MAG: hypothetical protein ACJ77D_10335 [Chloroflexota bacterium]